MFKINTSMLLESNREPIGNEVVKNTVKQKDYFSNSLKQVKSIRDEYNKAKAELYKGLVDSDDGSDSKMLSSVDCGEGQIPVKESSDSTTQFVRYFGKSVKVLNKAVGNIIYSTSAAKNQASIMQNEACDSTEYFLRKAKAKEAVNKVPGNGIEDGRCLSEGIDSTDYFLKIAKSKKAANTAPGNGNEGGGWVTEGCEGDNCLDTEKVYCFSTDRDIPTLKDSEYCNDELEDAICCKFKDDDYYKEKYRKLVNGMQHFMRKFRGLLAKCGECEEAEFARKLHESYCSGRAKVLVDEAYLDYCMDVVSHYTENVESVRKNAVDIAAGYQKAIENINKIAEISESKVSCDENGAAQLLTEEETQEIDLYCKAEIDKLVAMCNAHILSISAKLVSMQDEFNQCKAILDKYVNGINTVGNLPKDDDDDEEEDEYEKDDKKEKEDDDDKDDDDDGEKKDGDIIAGREPLNGSVASQESVRERLINYTDFLFEVSNEDLAFNRYINETVLNGIEGMELVSEGVVAAVKNGIHRIMNFLGNLWGKFANTMSSLFQKDQDYLNANKNIILGNKVKDATLSNWYDFNHERINNAAIPDCKGMDVAERFAVAMNATNVGGANEVDQEIKDCQDTDAIIAKYFSEYKNDNYDTFGDMVKFYLRGEAKSINANELNGKMNILFDFCFNYKSSMEPKLKESINKLNKMSEQATRSLNALEKVKEEENESPEGVQHFEGGGNPDGNAANNGEAKTTAGNESYTYDKMLSDYFNEVDIKTNASGASSDNTNNPKDKNINVKSNSDEKNAELDDAIQAAKSKDAKESGATKVNEEQKKMISNYINSVFTVDKAFFSAKMTVVHDCYKQYMAIIRWHVGQYKGSKSENKDSVNNNNQVGTEKNQATTIKV